MTSMSLPPEDMERACPSAGQEEGSHLNMSTVAAGCPASRSVPNNVSMLSPLSLYHFVADSPTKDKLQE